MERKAGWRSRDDGPRRFAVDDLEDTLARLRPHGAELVGEDGEVSRYGDSYLLCYLRGPSGIILALS